MRYTTSNKITKRAYRFDGGAVILDSATIERPSTCPISRLSSRMLVPPVLRRAWVASVRCKVLLCVVKLLSKVVSVVTYTSPDNKDSVTCLLSSQPPNAQTAVLASRVARSPDRTGEISAWVPCVSEVCASELPVGRLPIAYLATNPLVEFLSRPSNRTVRRAETCGTPSVRVLTEQPDPPSVESVVTPAYGQNEPSGRVATHTSTTISTVVLLVACLPSWSPFPVQFERQVCQESLIVAFPAPTKLVVPVRTVVKKRPISPTLIFTTVVEKRI